jgi:predicted RNase H-like HicB family nuclease
MKYRVILIKSDEGYAVTMPGLPGCHSQGSTEQEAINNITDAIREYVEAREDLLQEEPGAEIRDVEVMV